MAIRTRLAATGAEDYHTFASREHGTVKALKARRAGPGRHGGENLYSLW